MNDDIKQAELRGYSRGYQAGRARKKFDISEDKKRREKRAFWQRAFLASLPFCMEAQGWKRGERPITSLADRVRLARDTADEAVKYF